MSEPAVSLTRKARERLVEVARLAGLARLVPSVAHQLSTPLASIALRAESLERLVGEIEESDSLQKLRRHLQAIQDDIFRCKELLAVLQGFARAPGSALDEVDVNAVCRDAARLVRHEAMRRQVEIVPRLGEAVPRVRGDESRIGQGVLALVLNAIAASPAGGRVTLETTTQGGLVTVVVTDEGDGVGEEVQPRLFEAFCSTRPPEDGAGLGLMACQAALAACGGSVRWESTPGQGSRFILDLSREGRPLGSEDSVDDPP